MVHLRFTWPFKLSTQMVYKNCLPGINFTATKVFISEGVLSANVIVKGGPCPKDQTSSSVVSSSPIIVGPLPSKTWNLKIDRIKHKYIDLQDKVA